ncbi:protein of unknown function [Ruminococcaceae bacterium BL-4]|nr:protein of unknown function [Ruminococcaceae bacterium BL-4]
MAEDIRINLDGRRSDVIKIQTSDVKFLIYISYIFLSNDTE